MSLTNILNIAIIIESLLITVLVLLQPKGNSLSGGLLGGAMGGGEAFRSKRSIDKVLFNATMFVAAIFAITCLAQAAF